MNKNHLPKNILLLPSEKIFATGTHDVFFLVVGGFLQLE